MKLHVTTFSNDDRICRIEVDAEPLDLPGAPAGAFAVHRSIRGVRDKFTVTHVESGYRLASADTKETAIEHARVEMARRTPEEFAYWASKALAKLKSSTDQVNPDLIDDVQVLRRELRAAQGDVADREAIMRMLITDRDSIEGIIKSMAAEFSKIIVAHKLKDAEAVKSLLDDFCARHVIVKDERTPAGAVH